MNLSHTALKLIIMVILCSTRQFQHVSLFFKFKLFDNSFSVSVFWLDLNATPSHGLKFRNGYKKIEWQSKNGSQRKKIIIIIIIIIMKEDNYFKNNNNNNNNNNKFIKTVFAFQKYFLKN